MAITAFQTVEAKSSAMACARSSASRCAKRLSCRKENHPTAASTTTGNRMSAPCQRKPDLVDGCGRLMRSLCRRNYAERKAQLSWFCKMMRGGFGSEVAHHSGRKQRWFNSHPHPCPLPQERESSRRVLAGENWRGKSSRLICFQRRERCSLSSGERDGVRAGVSLNKFRGANCLPHNYSMLKSRSRFTSLTHAITLTPALNHPEDLQPHGATLPR